MTAVSGDTWTKEQVGKILFANLAGTRAPLDLPG